MKKKILGGVVAVAIAAVAAFNIQFNTNAENELSALSLANVEALASGEETVSIPCVSEQNETCRYSCKLADGRTGTCVTSHAKNV